MGSLLSFSYDSIIIQPLTRKTKELSMTHRPSLLPLHSEDVQIV